MKYTLALIALIIAGGFVVYTTQFSGSEQMEQPSGIESMENPFGEGSQEVGTVETGSTNPGTETGTTLTGTGNTGTPTSQPVTGSEGTPAAAPGVITRAELAKHKTQADCWIGYKGTVYDITNWLPRHPGSAGAIAPFCGTADEFASAFNQQHGTKRDARLEKEGVKEGALGN